MSARNADAAYDARTLGPLLAPRGPVRARGGPDVAFGPPGGAGAESVSVVSATLPAGAASGLVGALGPNADEAGARLLRETIAAEGLREPTLLAATTRRSATSGAFLTGIPSHGDTPYHLPSYLGV